MSRHIPFAEAEAARPIYEAEQFDLTKQPNPKWKFGDGLNGRTDLLGYDQFVEGATAEGSQQNFDHIDPDLVEDKSSIYKLLIGGINPRPIAFVSTKALDGSLNLAPFSFFSPVGYQPPLIMVHFTCPKPIIDGVGDHKNSLTNIKATKQFVVNIISEPFAEAANATSINAPMGVSEWDLSGLTPVNSDVVAPPRVGESPFAMECELEYFHDVFSDDDKRFLTGTMVLGRVKRFHVRKDLIGPTGAIIPSRLLPVSRMGGITYGRLTRGWDGPRTQWKEVEDDEYVKKLIKK